MNGFKILPPKPTHGHRWEGVPSGLIRWGQHGNGGNWFLVRVLELGVEADLATASRFPVCGPIMDLDSAPSAANTLAKINARCSGHFGRHALHRIDPGLEEHLRETIGAFDRVTLAPVDIDVHEPEHAELAARTVLEILDAHGIPCWVSPSGSRAHMHIDMAPLDRGHPDAGRALAMLLRGELALRGWVSLDDAGNNWVRPEWPDDAGFIDLITNWARPSTRGRLQKVAGGRGVARAGKQGPAKGRPFTTSDGWRDPPELEARTPFSALERHLPPPEEKRASSGGSHRSRREPPEQLAVEADAWAPLLEACRAAQPGAAYHEARLALAGALARMGMPQSLALAACQRIARTAEGQDDAQSAVESTYQRVAAGQPATGKKHLIKILGDAGEAILAAARRIQQDAIGIRINIPEGPRPKRVWRGRDNDMRNAMLLLQQTEAAERAAKALDAQGYCRCGRWKANIDLVGNLGDRKKWVCHTGWCVPCVLWKAHQRREQMKAKWPVIQVDIWAADRDAFNKVCRDIIGSLRGQGLDIQGASYKAPTPSGVRGALYLHNEGRDALDLERAAIVTGGEAVTVAQVADHLELIDKLWLVAHNQATDAVIADRGASLIALNTEWHRKQRLIRYKDDDSGFIPTEEDLAEAPEQGVAGVAYGRAGEEIPHTTSRFELTHEQIKAREESTFSRYEVDFNMPDPVAPAQRHACRALE